jgi:hypothetical protein
MDIAAHSIDTLNPGDLSNVAATVDNLALTIRDGWGEEADAASDALKRAAYLLGVADWTDKVRSISTSASGRLIPASSASPAGRRAG